MLAIFFAGGVALLVVAALALKFRGHAYTVKYKALLGCVMAGVDFSFDVLALGELRGGLLDAGIACIGVSLAINVAAIFLVLRASVRAKTLDLELVHEVAWLIALVLILSVTNLDTLVMLPWILPKRKCGKQHDFLGFPSKGIMFVTLLSVVFENIPQLTVTYLNAERHFVDEGKAIPTVVFTSMVTSGGMILYNVVRKVLTGCLGAALLRDDGGADGGHKITAVVPAAPAGKLGVAAATAAAAAAVVVN